MKIHKVIDLIENGMTVFEGSLEECQSWVNEQDDFFTYDVVPINEETSKPINKAV